jgi:hypothetical protein
MNYPRVNYEMTQEDCDTLLSSMQPVPMMMLGGVAPRSQQENANSAWRTLGKKMGFEWDTVQPIAGKGMLFFSAVPSENEEQRNERLTRESEERKCAEVKRLETVIAEAQSKLAAIDASRGSLDKPNDKERMIKELYLLNIYTYNILNGDVNSMDVEFKREFKSDYRRRLQRIRDRMCSLLIKG